MFGGDARDPRVAELRDALPGQILLGTGGVRYHLRERIGEGGQGWVYRATWDEPDGFFVTVKVLRPDSVSRDTLARFQREAEVLRTLSQQTRPNPHIVRFFDHAAAWLSPPRGGDAISLPFTVLEYVHGSNLERALAQSRGHGAPLERTRRILEHVVLALADVHRHDIVHRDLKPSNILLACEQGAEVAKVTDFGLVKLVDMRLQQTTALAGASLGYAPPEQYEQGNQRVTPRTDVFSLATIAYEMLCGTAAFPYREGEHPLVVITRLMNNARPPLAQMHGALPPELRARPDLVAQLDAELTRALKPDPAERHANANDFWAAFEPRLRAAMATPAGIIASPTRPSTAPPGVVHPYAQPEAHGNAYESTMVSAGLSAAIAEPVRGAPVAISQSHPPAPPIASKARTVPPERRSSGFPPPPTGAPTAAPTPSPSLPRASMPSAWSFRALTRPVRAESVRAAYFVGNGDVIIAVGPDGLLRWDRHTWSTLATPAGLDIRTVRGVAPLPTGDLLLFGERALAGRLTPAGTFHPWLSPDPSVTFLGGHVDEASAIVTLVGDRPTAIASARPGPASRVGCFAQFADGRLVLMSDTPGVTRLRAVTQAAPGVWLACGDWGAVVRLASGIAEHVGSVCGGHLTALAPIAPVPAGGLVTVGVGGHALFLTPRFEAHLEAVQTTRDLACIAVGEDGTPWAGAAQARLLRRTPTGWLRMSGDVGLSSMIMALHAGASRVRALCDDGAVLEGLLT